MQIYKKQKKKKKEKTYVLLTPSLTGYSKTIAAIAVFLAFLVLFSLAKQ